MTRACLAVLLTIFGAWPLWGQDVRPENRGSKEYKLGLDYYRGRKQVENQAVALGHFKKAAALGNPLGQFELAYFSMEGLGGQPLNRKQAAVLFDRAYAGCLRLAESGDPEAEVALGRMEQKAWGRPRDLASAVGHYRNAIEHGDPYGYAADNLAWLQLRGLGGLSKDHPAADKLWAAAWEKVSQLAYGGEAHAQYLLGLMLQLGLGRNPDLEKAVYWYRKADEQDDAQAEARLGYLYQSGKGVAKDGRKAANWYRQAANKQVAWAMESLGLMLLSGPGKDEKEAFHWFGEAASRDDFFAQRSLGLAYQGGHGCAVNPLAAKQWFECSLRTSLDAVEEGNASAEFNISTLYRDGLGVPRDAGKAAGWLQRAAGDGDIAAKTQLWNSSWLGRLVSLAGSPWQFVFAFVFPLVLAWFVSARALRHGGGSGPRGEKAWYAYSKASMWPGLLFTALFLTASHFQSNQAGQFIGRSMAPWFRYLPLPRPLLVTAVVAAYFGLFMACYFGGLFLLALFSYRVENRLRRTAWDLSSYAAWQARRLLVISLPLALVFLFLAMSASKSGALWFVMVPALFFYPWLYTRAYAWIWGMQKMESGKAVTLCRKLAGQTGVKVKGAYVWRTNAAKMANAMVLQNLFERRVIITDYLMKRVTNQELEAILGHEWGHLKNGHIWIRVLLLAIAGGALGAVSLLLPKGFPLWLAYLAGAPLFFVMQRKFELDADRFSMRALKNRRVLSSALRKLHKLNTLPSRWTWLDGLFKTHPSLAQRLESLQDA